MTCGWTGVYRHPLLSTQTCCLAIFRQFLDKPPIFMENLPKRGPLFREFCPQNPPIWAAHTRTLNMLCTPPSRGPNRRTSLMEGAHKIGHYEASRATDFLKYAKNYLPIAFVKTLYSSIVEPQFQYCCSVWGCCNSTDILQLQRLQNRAARVVTNSQFDAPSKPFDTKFRLTNDRAVDR